MTPQQIKILEQTITVSFIRSNVLSVAEAKEHAALAIIHMKNAMAGIAKEKAA